MKPRGGTKIIMPTDYTGKVMKMAMKKVIGMEDLITHGLAMGIITDLTTLESDGVFALED